MNFHSDEWIMDKVSEHYAEALTYFPEDRIVGIFYQGSGNYGIDYEGSDVDTKLVIVPTFEEIAMNKNPVSTTHVRANDEHIDWKDIRLMISCFKKQNINFLEILFTQYSIINGIYANQWMHLLEHKEEIAHYSPIQAIKAMRGHAHEKYSSMEHNYPSRIEWIKKFEYDPKQLCHLIRIEEYIERYISGVPYKDCLISEKPDILKNIKQGYYTLKDARLIAKTAIDHIDKMSDAFLMEEHKINRDIDVLLNNVQYEIIKTAIKKEICY